VEILKKFVDLLFKARINKFENYYFYFLLTCKKAGSATKIRSFFWL